MEDIVDMVEACLDQGLSKYQEMGFTILTKVIEFIVAF